MVKVKKEVKNLNNEFEQFTGTERYYKYWMVGKYMGTKYTDGVRAMANKFKAYWLIDIVFSYQDRKINKIPFQIWEIKSFKRKAVVTMKEDTDEPILVRQEIGFTDFPEGILTMYLIDNVLILPSEY